MSPEPSRGAVSSKRVLVAALSVTMVSTLPVFLTGALAVEMAGDFGLDPVDLGTALTGFFTVSALGSITLGGLADRLGWRNGMRLGVLASVICLSSIALAGSGRAILIASLSLGGLAMSIGNPSVNLALSTEIPVARQGLIFGVKHAAVPAAALLSGLALPAFALNFGWRPVYLGAASLAVALGLSIPRESTAARATRPRGLPTRDLDVTPLVFMAVAAAFGAWVASVLSAFLVASLVDSGFASGTAGFILAGASVGGLLTRIGAGWWADRRSGGLGGVAVLLLVGCVGLGFLASGSKLLIVGGSILAFGAGWGWNGLFNFAVVKHYPDAPARATSIALTGTYIGAALGPLITGTVAGQLSFRTAWIGTGALSATAAVVIMLARHRLRSMRPSPVPQPVGDS